MPREMRTSCTVGVAFALLGCFCTALQGEDRTVNDPLGLLPALLDAQITNQTLFPFGELQATVRDVSRGEQTALTLVWDGSRTYREYVVSQLDGGKSGYTRRQVESETESWFFDGEFTASHIMKKYRAGPSLFKLRPDENWYGVFNHDRPWSPYLDPMHPNWSDSSIRGSGTGAGDDITWNVTQESPDLIRARMDWNGRYSGFVDLLVSLEQGANVVEYSVEASNIQKDRIRRFGSFSWDQDSEQRWFLRSARYGEGSVAAGGKFPDRDEHSIDISIHHFDARHRPPESQFRKEALSIPEGVTLQTEHADGRRSRGIYGNPKKVATSPLINHLLERQLTELQHGGFIGRAPVKRN